VTHNGVVAAGGRLTNWISLGVLAAVIADITSPRNLNPAAATAATPG
jgi:hypothetical protein